MSATESRGGWYSRSRFFFAITFFFTLACSEKEDPSPETDDGNLVEAVVTASRTAAQLQFFIQLSGRDIDPGLFIYDVDIYEVVYKTSYHGTEINASGLVLLPKTNTAVPMVSFQHGTIVQQAQAPTALSTTSPDLISYSALASMGFVTVVPDFIGFGESQELFHPYYVEEPTAEAVVDMLEAATVLAETKQIDFNGKLFLAGYSQGGYATLAAHKSIENNPSQDFDLIASFPGAGGYDITSMQKYFFGLETYPDPYYLAYVGMSYQSYYGEEVLPDFFRDPYAGKIPSLFDGVKSPADIDNQLTPVIKDLVTAEILSGIDTDPSFQFLREKFEENSLVDWRPVAPVFMYHGDADITVPFENSQITYETLISNGASPQDLRLIRFAGKGHETAVEPYIVDVIKKLDSLTH
jgi:pimeloyl-ACP methyl ester carboxylesterase